jgi:hypothetical protein
VNDCHFGYKQKFLKKKRAGTLAAETLIILFSEMLKKIIILKIAIDNFRNIQSVCRNEHLKN